MARVVFADHLLALTGGQHEVDVVVADFRELVTTLDARWPGLGDALGRCAVAIDGQIFQDAYLEPIGSASEVYFLRRIEGG